MLSSTGNQQSQFRTDELSESEIVRVRKLSDGRMIQVMLDGSTRPYVSPNRTNWARLEAMTEEEIEANALADPDNPPLTDEELARMRPVPNPRRIRERLKLTQEQFAAQFEVSLGTLRDWEQGVRVPDRAARTLLRVIDQDPEAVIEALAKSYLPRVQAPPESR
jgi:putative transcriptional regulator